MCPGQQIPAECACAVGTDVTLAAYLTANQGRTKTRLVLDPQRAPVVAQVFGWRTVDRLGVTTITNRLNASPGQYPSPKPGGWTAGGVYAILRNPK